MQGEGVRWYLLPFFEWIARNWLSLLHEEHFAWRENTSASAATATFLATRRLIAATSNEDLDLYDEVHAWWSRHSLRAADTSALLPDLFLRRLRDDIEISWTARQPSFPPDGFRMDISPGLVTLPVSDVAAPLWEALNWAVSTAIVTDDLDRASIAALDSSINSLRSLTIQDLSKLYLSPELSRKVSLAITELDVADRSSKLPAIPAVDTFGDAVLMFGGASPDIYVADATKLIGFLKSRFGHAEKPQLTALVDLSVGLPLAAPYTEGYDLAEQLLDTLDLDDAAGFVDIVAILNRLGISIVRESLDTTSIRGVAIAGLDYAPSILINMTSPYNRRDGGERFTLAHELFHILYDRSRARRVAHTSGPWAAPGIEKRANAFAAMLLMPRRLTRSLLPLHSPELADIQSAASSLRVGVSALIEHLYNTDLIDEISRDELRNQIKSG